MIMYGTTNLQFCGVFMYIDLVLQLSVDAYCTLYKPGGTETHRKFVHVNLCCHTKQLIYSPVLVT